MTPEDIREAEDAAKSVRMARTWEVVIGEELKHVDSSAIPEDFRICAAAVPRLLEEREQLRAGHQSTGQAILDALRQHVNDGDNILEGVYSIVHTSEAPLDAAVRVWRAAGMPPLGGGEDHEATIAGLRNEGRVYRDTIRRLLKKNEELKNPPADPLTKEERERLNYLTEEQRKNALANHAMAVPKLRELIALQDRAGL